MYLVLKRTKLKDKLSPYLHQLIKFCSLKNTSSPLCKSARIECMEEEDWGQSWEQKQKWKHVWSPSVCSKSQSAMGRGLRWYRMIEMIQRQLLYNITPNPASCGRSSGNAQMGQLSPGAHWLCVSHVPEFQGKEREWAAWTALLSLLPNLPPWPACLPAPCDLMWMSTATSGATFKRWQSCRMEGVWLPDSLLGGQPPAS